VLSARDNLLIVAFGVCGQAVVVGKFKVVAARALEEYQSVILFFTGCAAINYLIREAQIELVHVLLSEMGG